MGLVREPRVTLCAIMAGLGCVGGSTAGCGGRPATAQTESTSSGSGGETSSSSGGEPSQAPAVGTFESGSRLRAHVYDAGEGAAMFIDWTDTMLDEPCRFQLADDGEWRCLPFGSDPSSVRFIDPACTTYALRGFNGQPLPRFATKADAGCTGDPSVVHVFEVTGEWTTAATSYDFVDGACVEYGLGNGEHLFALEWADTSSFLRADLITESRTDAFDVQVRIGEDGSRQLGAVLDRDRGGECRPPASENAVFDVDPRCFPIGLANGFGAYFGDPECSTPGGYESPAPVDCPPPNYLVVSSTENCATAHDIWSLGTEAGTLYFLSDGTCLPLEANETVDFFPAMEQVDADEFSALVMTKLGAGRLQLPLLTARDDDTVLADYGIDQSFWDSEREEYCELRRFGEGAMRCVSRHIPESYSYDNLFADEACTQRLVAASSCVAAEYAYDASSESLVSIEGLHSGTIYELLSPSSCSPSPVVGDFWILGDEVDPGSVFAAVTEITE